MSSVRVRLTLLEKDGNEPGDMALGASTECLLEAAKPIIIGRAGSVDIRVKAPSVGRQVVRLSLRPDGVWVEDLGSGGGSSIEAGGSVIDRPHCMLPGDTVLRLGHVAFRAELLSEPSSGSR